MSHKRGYVLILVLASLISGLSGILGNVAAGLLPPAWQPYLWLAWPLFGLLTLAGVGLAVWQHRVEQRAASSPPASERPAPPATPPRPVLPRPAAPAGDFAYDVFISYSHHDQAWVTGALLPRLEAAGLRACVDWRDFTPGKAALLNMQDAVENSRRTLLVLTPAWLASEWTLYESLLTATSDPAGLRRRTVPLRLRAGDLPEFISMLTWVDFTRPEREAIAWTQLLTALGAPPAQEAPAEPERSEWRLAHPYPMPPNFTGRAQEREMLSDWLAADAARQLLVLRALGGFGKSALAWHWLLHDVDPAAWPRVVWWSFYEGDASFDSFLGETLAYLGLDPRRLGPRQQADELLRLMRRPGVLLVLDGFERALRAYGSLAAAYQGDESPPPRAGEGGGGGEDTDCLSPAAGHFLRSLACLPGLRGKALLTTRLRPRILETHGGDLLAGCREVELTQMQPADAVAFFRAQGARGGRAEIQAACAPYGYHPLSLRLLAGLILRDPQQPGDVAAAGRLDVSGDLAQRRHHVLQQAYDSLTPPQQRLLGRLACFRGPVAYAAIAAVAAGDGGGRDAPLARLFRRRRDKLATCPTPDAHLRELVARGLAHHDRGAARYDLHPIARRYAYDRLTAAERLDAHGQLRDYFAAAPPPDKVTRLEDLAPVIELCHHTVRAGQYDEAVRLFRDRLNEPLYYQFGAYQLRIELLRALFPDGEAQPPRLEDEAWRAWTLNALANSYSLSGQPRRAAPLFEASNAIDEKRGNKLGVAIGLGNLADDQLKIGALRAAEANLRRSIALGRELEDEFREAVGRRELGRLLAIRGDWAGAEEELAAALALFEKQQHVQAQGIVWAYRAQRALLLARAAAAPSPLPDGRGEGAGGGVRAARRALELADEDARTIYPVERDYVDAHWLLGAAHRAAGDPAAAERCLSEALARCRGINAVDVEADILLDLARLAALQSAPAAQEGRDEALRLAQEALAIAERCGYVLQSADAHLLLAQLAHDGGDDAAALAHAQEARRLATRDGPPDYTYKAAYDEAGAWLEGQHPISNI